MRRKTLALFVLALAIPGAALAAKPTTHANQSQAAPKVMYILKGTLSNFTAATTSANGSITITVAHSNFHAHALVGQTLTFAVTTKTTTTLNNKGTIKDGAKGIVKFKAPLKVSNTSLLAMLAPNQMTARAVIDKG
jgi:hypothetical protein